MNTMADADSAAGLTCPSAGCGGAGSKDCFRLLLRATRPVPKGPDVYDDAPGLPRIAAYRTYLAQILEVAGYSAAEAGRIADLAIAIETELHAAKLKPVEAVDPRSIYNPLTFADLQAQIPELDLSIYFQETGYPLPDRIIQTEPRLLPVLSQMLREGQFRELLEKRGALAGAEGAAGVVIWF
jgi:predicted metalloendopeptidase